MKHNRNKSKTNLTEYSKNTCRAISTKLFDKVFKFLIVPFSKEEATYREIFKNDEVRRAEMIYFMSKHLEHLKFNSYQIGLAVCYADRFATGLANQGFKFTYRLIKSVVILSITAAYKMTSDECYSTLTLERSFRIYNLDELEATYYELVNYHLYFTAEDIEKYLKTLL